MGNMKRVKKIFKQTDNRFLNMYELEGVMRNGGKKTYYMASRTESPEDLKLHNSEMPADAILVYARKGDCIVLEKQYRFPIDDYIYELPAGLIEPGESVKNAAEREFFEETGMNFTMFTEHNSSRPYYISIGMSDESVITVFGFADGEPTSENQEESEDITVVLADREECRRILREENVAVPCAYLLYSFITSDDSKPFEFLV